YHACAILASKPFCWGANAKGQLGVDPTTTPSSPAPLMVPGATASSLAAGFYFSCSLRNSGGSGIDCWGDMRANPAAMGPFPFTPAQVAGITDATRVCTGAAHACAITATGGVRCWGDNSVGAVGLDMGTKSYPAPSAAVPGVTGAISLACGNNHTCVVTT